MSKGNKNTILNQMNDFCEDKQTSIDFGDKIKSKKLKELFDKVNDLYEQYDNLFDLRDRGYSVSYDELKKAEEKYDYYLALYKEMKKDLGEI